MRIFLLSAAVLGFATIAAAQAKAPAPAAPNPADVKFEGDRFRPLTWAEMTPAQKTMTQHLLDGDRHGVGGPFNVLLRSPEMGDLAQAFGAAARFHSSLPPKLNEFAILITARFWTVQFEWNSHRRSAAQAGLSADIIQAVAAGKRPSKMQPDEEVVYNFGTELLKNHSVSDPTYAAAVKLLGERGVVDMISVMGYYQLVAMLLDVDRYPMPAGVAPELKPLP
jgi:4-carboxymuconolactone decarboxylase